MLPDGKWQSCTCHPQHSSAQIPSSFSHSMSHDLSSLPGEITWRRLLHSYFPKVTFVSANRRTLSKSLWMYPSQSRGPTGPDLPHCWRCWEGEWPSRQKACESARDDYTTAPPANATSPASPCATAGQSKDKIRDPTRADLQRAW